MSAPNAVMGGDKQVVLEIAVWRRRILLQTALTAGVVALDFFPLATNLKKKVAVLAGVRLTIQAPLLRPNFHFS
jgi:hypothetical protein